MKQRLIVVTCIFAAGMLALPGCSSAVDDTASTGQSNGSLEAEGGYFQQSLHWTGGGWIEAGNEVCPKSVECASADSDGSNGPNGPNGKTERANFGFNVKRCTDNNYEPFSIDGETNGGNNGGSYERIGHFNYVDIGAGVKMNGPIVDAAACGNNSIPKGDEVSSNNVIRPGLCGKCRELLYGAGVAVKAYYRSTNPQYSGSGWVIGCFDDNGEGKKASNADRAAVYVESGPFDGYRNRGDVQGNVQEHLNACKANGTPPPPNG